MSLPITATRAAPMRACPSGPISGSAICRANRSASTGNGRDDRDLVRVLDRRIQVLEEANVFVVGEDVDEAPDLAAVVADPLLDPRILRLEAGDQRADRGAG